MKVNQVRCFSSSPDSGESFVCCQKDDDWDVVQHFPLEMVLKHVAEVSRVLLEHPQVRRLDRKTMADVGQYASGIHWATSFWIWYRRQCASVEEHDLKLGSEPHIFDHLEVLWHQEVDKSVTLKPLWERARALHCRDLEAPMVACLRACNVLLVVGCDCPPVDRPDALARALFSAWKGHGECINPDVFCEDRGWRDLLHILIKSPLPEAKEMAKVLPLFKDWQGKLVSPQLQLFQKRPKNFVLRCNPCPWTSCQRRMVASSIS